MLEETGCEIAVGAELGEIVEYRSGHGFDWLRNLHQTSYCFLADITAKGVPEFTESEIDEGFELRWMTLDEAIAQLERDMPDNAEGKFIVQRDLKFLRAAREIRG